MEVVGITTEDAAEDVGVRDVCRAIRVQENALGESGSTAVIINVECRPAGVCGEVAIADVEDDVVCVNSAREEDPSVELDVAQRAEVDDYKVGRAAVDGQRLAAAVSEAGRIKYMDHLSVVGEHVLRSTGGTYYRAVADRAGCSTLGVKRLRQRVDIVHGGLYGRDTVLDPAGDDVASIVVGELARIRGREVDPAVDGGRATVRRLSRASDPNVAVARDIGDLERVTADPFEEDGVVLATPEHERRRCPLQRQQWNGKKRSQGQCPNNSLRNVKHVIPFL